MMVHMMVHEGLNNKGNVNVTGDYPLMSIIIIIYMMMLLKNVLMSSNLSSKYENLAFRVYKDLKTHIRANYTFKFR